LKEKRGGGIALGGVFPYFLTLSKHLNGERYSGLNI
jgi:hypothetical protein